jgi:hypothetical protein
LHGCGKVEGENGWSYWGDHKEHNNEGYGTLFCIEGDTYIGQFKQDKRNGYGINRWSNGVAHYG